jgi:hypothetical protein
MRIDPSSLLIGIYGECGDCKSTALDFIEQRLYESAAESVVCVRCNPWLYGDAIYANLGTTPEKVGKHLRQVGTVVRGVSLGTSTVTAACIVVQEGGGA